jgi:hypothetical protein
MNKQWMNKQWMNKQWMNKQWKKSGDCLCSQSTAESNRLPEMLEVTARFSCAASSQMHPV